MAPSQGHPVSRGSLCARGWAAHEASRWGERVLHPLVRTGGELRPTTWDEALSLAARSLAGLRDAGRPLGVLGSGRISNEGNFLAAALARTGLGTGNVDAGLRSAYDVLLGDSPEGWTADASEPRSDEPTGAFETLESSDLILLMEGDLASTHPRLALGVMRALRRGGRLLTLGWSRTQMSRLAALHLSLPAADPLRLLVELRARTLGVGGTFPPSGEDVLRQAGSWLAAAQRAVFVVGPFDGDLRVLRGAAELLAYLAWGLGKDGRRTARVLALPVRANTRGALDMGAVPDRLPGRRSVADPTARTSLQAVWGGKPCWDEGLGAAEMPGAVAGMVVVGDDFSTSHPLPARALEALEGLESLVVVESFLTPTALRAQVVLPMAAFGEEAGTLTSLDGRVQRWRAWGPPPAGVRPGWRILRDLLEALGGSFLPRTLEDVFQGIGEAIPAYAALDRRGLAEGWGDRLRPLLPGAPAPHACGELASEAIQAFGAPLRPLDGRKVLRWEGVFDWGDDPLVLSSPILRRDPVSRAKLSPRGLVAMSPEVGKALGVREGWKVRLRSKHGEAEVPVTLRPGLEPGVLLVPFAFRDALSGVSGGDGVVEVEVV